MLHAIASLGGIGLVIGAILAYAAKIFAVESDPRIEAIVGVLPGANCGACGYAGCAALAGAIAAGQAPVDACPVGRAPVAEKVAEIMGINAGGPAVKKQAQVLCQGGKDIAKTKYEYAGIDDCQAAAQVAGGPKSCEYACIGLGSCAEACPFGAISVSADGLPVIDGEICTGCGVCVKTCPKQVLDLVPQNSRVQVRCNSNAKGAAVRPVCQKGCIGCGICAKNCPAEAIRVEDNLAKIDYDKCTGCGICAAKCPTKAITAGGEEAESKRAAG